MITTAIWRAVMTSDLRHGFRLGPWNIEPLRGAVTGPNGEAQHLEPKVMDTLSVLVEHANELVTREDLFDAVWQGQSVSDERLTHVIAELRNALEDDRGHPRFIETVPKRGYRLIGQVRPLADSKPAPITSIAVLPLKNMTGDPEQEYFADGMTEALITELSKIGALRVISRPICHAIQRHRSVHAGDCSAPECRCCGGRLRAAIGDRVRITAQLIEAATDLHLWGDSYDRDLRDVLALHSEVARAIAEAIRIAVTPDETRLLASASEIDPEAHRLYLHQYHLYKWGPADLEKAMLLSAGYRQRFQTTRNPMWACRMAELAFSACGLKYWPNGASARTTWSDNVMITTRTWRAQ